MRRFACTMHIRHRVILVEALAFIVLYRRERKRYLLAPDSTLNDPQRSAPSWRAAPPRAPRRRTVTAGPRVARHRVAMDAASLNALTLINDASSSLEASLKESQGALHQQRLQRVALQDEVSVLSSYAAAVPLLEREVLAQGDRADALEDALRVVIAKNEALQTFAHLRVRARSGLQGAEGLRCLAACLADLAVQRAFGLWRHWTAHFPARSEVERAEAGGPCVAGSPGNFASGYSSGFHSKRLARLELQQAEERLEALAQREAALAYDNMLLQRTQRVDAVQARRSAAAASLVVWWRHRQSWVLGRAWRSWLLYAWCVPAREPPHSSPARRLIV